jgi:hypothetical protein
LPGVKPPIVRRDDRIGVIPSTAAGRRSFARTARPVLHSPPGEGSAGVGFGGV